MFYFTIYIIHMYIILLSIVLIILVIGIGRAFYRYQVMLFRHSLWFILSATHYIGFVIQYLRILVCSTDCGYYFTLFLPSTKIILIYCCTIAVLISNTVLVYFTHFIQTSASAYCYQQYSIYYFMLIRSSITSP